MIICSISGIICLKNEQICSIGGIFSSKNSRFYPHRGYFFSFAEAFSARRAGIGGIFFPKGSPSGLLSVAPKGLCVGIPVRSRRDSCVIPVRARGVRSSLGPTGLARRICTLCSRAVQVAVGSWVCVIRSAHYVRFAYKGVEPPRECWTLHLTVKLIMLGPTGLAECVRSVPTAPRS